MTARVKCGLISLLAHYVVYTFIRDILVQEIIIGKKSHPADIIKTCFPSEATILKHILKEVIFQFFEMLIFCPL